jgi:DNA-binding beta-propeller fold protein YncE
MYLAVGMPIPLLTVLFATTISLPGGPPIGMDYLTYDPATNRVWVPAGNTGNVDVIDVATGTVISIAGLATAPPRRPGRPRMGPSSATVGEGVVWVGNRGDNQLHAYDAKTLAAKGVVQLPSMPDGLAYVRATHELWVTTPGDKTLTLTKVNGKTPGPLMTIRLDGSPEGYAVDDWRGIFYTNLEDKYRTLAIDVKTHKIVGDWPAPCGAEGPRGLALDTKQRWLFVACTNGAAVLELDHNGKLLGRITTDGGVDNLDYDTHRRLLFVASGQGANLVIAHVDDGGALRTVSSVPTAKGARNPVLDGHGTAYVEDSANGRLLVVEPLTDGQVTPKASR